jgi:hypothetical protein
MYWGTRKPPGMLLKIMIWLEFFLTSLTPQGTKMFSINVFPIKSKLATVNCLPDWRYKLYSTGVLKSIFRAWILLSIVFVERTVISWWGSRNIFYPWLLLFVIKCFDCATLPVRVFYSTLRWVKGFEPNSLCVNSNMEMQSARNRGGNSVMYRIIFRLLDQFDYSLLIHN